MNRLTPVTARSHRLRRLAAVVVLAAAVAETAPSVTLAGSGAGQPPAGTGQRLGKAAPDSAPSLQPPPGAGVRMGRGPADTTGASLQPPNPHPDASPKPLRTVPPEES